MKLKRILFSGVVLAAMFTVGCSSSDSTMTDQEVNALKHPSGKMNAAAIEGMSHMGELMKKQQEAIKAAGVDSRGVPLAKSVEKGDTHAAAAPTPPAAK